MALGSHKWLVIRRYPTAKLGFYKGRGYCIEVGEERLSRYEWSPVNAWKMADLQPIFPPTLDA